MLLSVSALPIYADTYIESAVGGEPEYVHFSSLEDLATFLSIDRSASYEQYPQYKDAIINRVWINEIVLPDYDALVTDVMCEIMLGITEVEFLADGKTYSMSICTNHYPYQAKTAPADFVFENNKYFIDMSQKNCVWWMVGNEAVMLLSSEPITDEIVPYLRARVLSADEFIGEYAAFDEINIEQPVEAILSEKE